MTTARWMLYGANGYTGELIAREAVRRGMAPLLAGRNPDAIARLGMELGLETVDFGLAERASIVRWIAGCNAVLNCAGPFSGTAAPMIEACLASRAHYLDITGEIDVFEAALTRVQGLAMGGRIRSAGRIRRVAHAFRRRSIDFGDGTKTAVTIPWGDVSTAFHTTGIPNIEVYIPMRSARIASLRRLGRVAPLPRFVESLEGSGPIRLESGRAWEPRA